MPLSRALASPVLPRPLPELLRLAGTDAPNDDTPLDLPPQHEDIVIGIVARIGRGYGNRFRSRIAHTAAETLLNAGIRPLVLDRLSDEERYAKFPAVIDDLMAQGVRGVICIEHTPDDEQGAGRYVLRRELPSVWITDTIPLTAVPTVSCDNDHAGYLAALHLVETGCRRIVFPHPADIWSDPTQREEFSWLIQRIRGAERACQRFGGMFIALPLSTTLHHSGDAVQTWHEMGISAAARILDFIKMPGRAGIAALNDRFALGLQSALVAPNVAGGRSYTSPEHYALLGCDDIPEATEADLTTLAPPVEVLGQRAAELILSLVVPSTAAGGSPVATLTGNTPGTATLRAVRVRPTLRIRTTTRREMAEAA